MTSDEYKTIHTEVNHAWNMLQTAYEHMLSADILAHDCYFTGRNEAENFNAMAAGFQGAEMAFHTAVIELSKADVACYKEME